MQDDAEERTNTLQVTHRIYKEAAMIIVAERTQTRAYLDYFLVLEALKR